MLTMNFPMLNDSSSLDEIMYTKGRQKPREDMNGHGSDRHTWLIVQVITVCSSCFELPASLSYDVFSNYPFLGLTSLLLLSIILRNEVERGSTSESSSLTCLRSVQLA